MAKKQPLTAPAKPEPIIPPELTPEERKTNAAKAAGAERVIQLMTTHPMRKTVEGYVRTLGDHASYERGTDLANELAGVREAIRWVKKNYEGPAEIGDASGLVSELSDAIKKQNVAAQVAKAAESRKAKEQAAAK